jgi:lysine N6-hydroxylase
LHEHGRVYHFVNAQFDSVPRQEFRNYRARASRNNENVAFGEEVLGIEFENVFTVPTSQRAVTAFYVDAPPPGELDTLEKQFRDAVKITVDQA